MLVTRMWVKTCFINTQTNQKYENKIDDIEWGFALDTLHAYCSKICKKEYYVSWHENNTCTFHIEIDNNETNINIVNREFVETMEYYSEYGVKDEKTYVTFEIIPE